MFAAANYFERKTNASLFGVCQISNRSFGEMAVSSGFLLTKKQTISSL